MTEIAPTLAAAAITSLVDAVIATDTTGRIQLWNRAAEQFFDYSAEQAIGQSLAIIIPASARPAHIDGFRRAMHTGTTDSAGEPTTVTAQRADGSTIDLEMSLSVLRACDGTVAGAVAAIRAGGQRRPLISYQPTDTEGHP